MPNKKNGDEQNPLRQVELVACHNVPCQVKFRAFSLIARCQGGLGLVTQVVVIEKGEK